MVFLSLRIYSGLALLLARLGKELRPVWGGGVGRGEGGEWPGGSWRRQEVDDLGTVLGRPLGRGEWG